MEGPCTDFCADLCDDNNPCTQDLCDESRGCDNTVFIDCNENDACINEYCDDGIYCNGDEFCVEGECQEGTPPTCDDGIECTDDYCDPDLDSCQNIPDNDYCDNHLLCDGDEICDTVSGCLPGEDLCPGMDCDEDEGLLDRSCGLTDASSAGDWRLPTSEEWENFVCGEYSNPAVCNTEGSGQWSEGDPFSSVQSYYWSSSEDSPTNVRYMDMSNGIIYMIEKSVPLYVWPVCDEGNWVLGIANNL